MWYSNCHKSLWWCFSLRIVRNSENTLFKLSHFVPNSSANTLIHRQVQTKNERSGEHMYTLKASLCAVYNMQSFTQFGLNSSSRSFAFKNVFQYSVFHRPKWNTMRLTSYTRSQVARNKEKRNMKRCWLQRTAAHANKHKTRVPPGRLGCWRTHACRSSLLWII